MMTDEPHMYEDSESDRGNNDQPGLEDDRRQAAREWLRETEAFAQEVARRWPSSLSSVELIREQRREL
jgi:hypothetical protein